jgi:hypothetical protein
MLSYMKWLARTGRLPSTNEVQRERVIVHPCYPVKRFLDSCVANGTLSLEDFSDGGPPPGTGMRDVRDEMRRDMQRCKKIGRWLQDLHLDSQCP